MNGLKHSPETKVKMSELRKGEKNSFYGKHHSDDTKEKISKSLKSSEKFKLSLKSVDRSEKISKAMKKRFISEETKKKISESNKGKKRSKEHNKRMSEIMKKLKPLLNYKHSEETKKKIGLIHKGKEVSKKTREKIRKANIGKILPEDTKLKISKSLQTKEIGQYDLNGLLINSWDSAKDASRDLGMSVRKIGYFCRKNNINNKYRLMYKVNL